MAKKEQRKIIVVVGPTASGKSSFGVALAKKIGGEIISADSRQVYRGLDIGTGKITKREMRGIPHHLLDVVSPKRTFTAHDFTNRARRVIDKIASRGKTPIVVGGTGFYIDALVGRISLPVVPPDPNLRARLRKKTARQLYALLRKRNPRRAKMLASLSERNNKVRLIRALEIASVAHNEGSPRSAEGSPRRYVWIGLLPPQLDTRIAKRLRMRIQNGMIAEGKKLHAAGLSYKRMRELGLEYRSLADLLSGKISREEFEKRLAREIRRYAKKQLAYWRRNKEIRWIDPADKRQVRALERALIDR